MMIDILLDQLLSCLSIVEFTCYAGLFGWKSVRSETNMRQIAALLEPKGSRVLA